MKKPLAFVYLRLAQLFALSVAAFVVGSAHLYAMMQKLTKSFPVARGERLTGILERDCLVRSKASLERRHPILDYSIHRFAVATPHEEPSSEIDLMGKTGQFQNLGFGNQERPIPERHRHTNAN